MIRRFENWPTLAERAISERDALPFSWGLADCCLLPCDVVLAMTGFDPAAWFRGRYSTAIGASSALKSFLGLHRRLPFAEMMQVTAAVISRSLGFEEISVLKAGRGDIVFHDDANGASLGIVDLSGRAALVKQIGAVGWTAVSLSTVARAWRVG